MLVMVAVNSILPSGEYVPFGLVSSTFRNSSFAVWEIAVPLLGTVPKNMTVGTRSTTARKIENHFVNIDLSSNKI